MRAYFCTQIFIYFRDRVPFKQISIWCDVISILDWVVFNFRNFYKNSYFMQMRWNWTFASDVFTFVQLLVGFLWWYFHQFLVSSIAIWTLYNFGLECVVIGWNARPQIREKWRGSQRHLPPSSWFIGSLRPNASSDRLALKRLSIEHSKSFRTV